MSRVLRYAPLELRNDWMVEDGARRFSTQISDNLTSAIKWLIRRSDRRDESMSKKQDLLDEVFRLMQQQMQARPGSILAAHEQEYKKRAERLDELLSQLKRQNTAT